MLNEVNKTNQFERLQYWSYWWGWIDEVVVELTSDSVVYISVSVTIGSGIISTNREGVMLVLLNTKIYDMRHWDSLWCHDVHTEFHEN
jgi:hypothetical protein